MQNISYFCIVKHFKYFLRSLLGLFLAFVPATMNAQETDSLQVSLLTCGPGNEVYSYYGHTAIRLKGWSFYFFNAAGLPVEKRDVVVNYGSFSFRQKYFIARFILGLTDYEVSLAPFELFVAEYNHERRWVREQVLNLTLAEKEALYEAICRNLEPQNKTYRYNYFTDNCTTRARNIILGNMSDEIVFDWESKPASTYREMIHQYNRQHLWAAFGNDLLLGLGADSPIDAFEQQFLPIPLSNDFEHATIARNGNKPQKLVKATNQLVSMQENPHKAEPFLFSPMMCACCLCLLLIIVTAVEIKRKQTLWQTDAITMLVTGLAGIILFVMIFSQHPTVRCNLQIMLLNPLNLVFLYPAVKRLRRGKLHAWHVGWMVMLLLCATAGSVGIQHYADGILLLAYTLLFRQCAIVYRLYQHKTKTN